MRYLIYRPAISIAVPDDVKPESEGEEEWAAGITHDLDELLRTRAEVDEIDDNRPDTYEYPDDDEDKADDDPQCVCGVHRSEHTLLGCPEGFQIAADWAVEREFIRSLDDDEYERIYHREA